MSMEWWTFREIGLAALVISLLLAVLANNVDLSGAWDGDPINNWQRTTGVSPWESTMIDGESLLHHG